MKEIRTWLRRMTEYSRASIRRQVLFLVLACGIGTFVATLMLFGYSMHGLQESLEDEGRDIEEVVAESVGNTAKKRTRAWLKSAVENEAAHIDRELAVNSADAELLADSMTMMMQSRDKYGEGKLVNDREVADIASGTAYLHYSPQLAAEGVGADLAAEISRAANFADMLVPMAKSYMGCRTSLVVASRKGYSICVDVLPGEPGQSIYPSPEARTAFLEKYDARQRPWYQAAQAKGGNVFTDVFMGEEGFLALSFATPYYDEEGFAGVIGINGSVEDLQSQVKQVSIGRTGISFCLNGKGRVVLSSEGEGLLAPNLQGADLRENSEPTLAEAARRMTAGESDVVKVLVDGQEYYLAFAPMHIVGWSFGALIGRDEVLAPAQEVTALVHEEMKDFYDTLNQDFAWMAGKVLLLLGLLALAAFFTSGALADRILRPIRALAEGVQEIADGNLDKKLEIHTGNEVEELAICFNEMTENLKDHVQRLSQAAAKEERARTELEVAARIQAGLLPAPLKPSVQTGNFGLSAFMEPAKEVGGDLYDFYFLDEDLLAVTVADVSDKGVPAALFMVMAKTLLKDQVLLRREEKDLARAVAEANDALVQSNTAFMFVTAFIGILHLPSGSFTYVNAGHNPPLLCRRGRAEYLPKAKNPILGVRGGMTFVAEKLTLQPGDSLFLYTDGVTEAMDSAGGFFGERRLQETLSAKSVQGAGEQIGMVLEAVSSFVGEASQSDDITMLALAYGKKDEN
ncbi:SpoIIE family protein phosphatase [Selenomonas sp. KH1T6]|uniref:SpoIIE family protein phosphatase n=1 Tax=Selenomonas sp. KH1T6 TaxID=3158784 RepID=UPI0008A7DD68|nr:sigma-B regulation protein RsbU (phosphoserine phosphatase) [Selenomonas ruminantium]